jgi:hypothetical protein
MSAIIQLSLTSDQEALLAPLVKQACDARRNLFFIAVAVPRDGAWELQVVSVPATIGPKLRRLFKTEKKQRETPRTA